MLRRNNRFSNRRGRRPAGMTSAVPLGSTRGMPFLQYVPRTISSLVAGNNSINFTFATLASDLSSTRLIRLRAITVKFYAFSDGLATLPPTVQLLIRDQSTGQDVPVTQVRPLSLTNTTTLVGNLPMLSWITAGSGNVCLTIQVTSSVIANIGYDIQSRFVTAQDVSF
jgi:hypothetical protein